MSKSAFGTKELRKFLEKYKFTPTEGKPTRHLKYTPPSSFQIAKTAKFPFIVVVLNRSQYDPITANSIRRQLENFGFTKGQVKNGLG